MKNVNVSKKCCVYIIFLFTISNIIRNVVNYLISINLFPFDLKIIDLVITLIHARISSAIIRLIVLTKMTGK
jgi:hypothetical protein